MDVSVTEEFMIGIVVIGICSVAWFERLVG